jgi:hypothetical protein
MIRIIIEIDENGNLKTTVNPTLIIADPELEKSITAQLKARKQKQAKRSVSNVEKLTSQILTFKSFAWNAKAVKVCLIQNELAGNVVSLLNSSAVVKYIAQSNAG